MDYKKNKNISDRCAGYTNNLRVENARQPEQKTHRQKPTVRLQHRRFLSISHEQTSAPGVSYKWGDVGRGEKIMEEKEDGVDRKAMILHMF